VVIDRTGRSVSVGAGADTRAKVNASAVIAGMVEVTGPWSE
jgi:hypothetical protein